MFLNKIILLFLFSIPSFSFADCSCKSSGSDTIIETQTELGKRIIVRLPANPVTQKTREATICSIPNLKLLEAKLWMPAHGHGSAPTSVTQENSDCAVIKKLSFVMLGKWEIAMLFEDDDKATVEVEIQ
ncbi:MAG: hypothetical protein EXR74_03765 [Bdellovibrionales bacterium]|nr:hypothetical protein [Bdellovibrionales bacterium]